MQRSKERLAMFFDMKLMASSAARGIYREVEGLAPKSMTDLLRYVERLKDDPEQDLVWPRKSKADILYLVDISLNRGSNQAVLLINRCDPNSADAVFYDPATRTRTRHEKKPGEGSDHSSHVVISLVPSSPNVYRAIVEMCPGLSSGRLEAYLNYLLHQCSMQFRADFEVEHIAGAVENGKPVKVRSKPKLKMMGQMSPEFEDELKAGQLNSIELIRVQDVVNPWDDAGELVERDRIVRIRESEKGVVADKLEKLRELCGKVKNDYGYVRVTFKTPEGMIRSAKLDAETAGFADDFKYIKKRVVDGFNNHLPSAFDAIDNELKEKLCALL